MNSLRRRNYPTRVIGLRHARFAVMPRRLMLTLKRYAETSYFETSEFSFNRRNHLERQSFPIFLVKCLISVLAFAAYRCWVSSVVALNACSELDVALTTVYPLFGARLSGYSVKMLTITPVSR